MIVLAVHDLNANLLRTDLLRHLPVDQNVSLELKDLGSAGLEGNRYFLDVSPYDDNSTLKSKVAPRYRKTYEDFFNLQLLSFTILLGLWAAPQGTSNWDHEKIQQTNLIEHWEENVKAGPVMDTDDWWINYIGHSLSGAYFYTLARNNDMTVKEATVFNFLMSTFYWEYGVEAFFEKPSIQDIIITPVLGSLLGEYFYTLQEEIIKNHGEVWGSKSLGTFCLVLLNPEGVLADYLRLHEDWVNFHMVTHIQTYMKKDPVTEMLIPNAYWLESYLGLQLDVKF